MIDIEDHGDPARGPDPFSSPNSGLRSVLEVFDRSVSLILTLLTGLFSSLTFVVVFWGAFSRYVFNAPVSWSEDIAKYGMIYGVMTGAALAYRHGAEISFGTVYDKLSVKARGIRATASDVAVFAMGIMLAVSGLLFAASRGAILSPSLGIPMAFAQVAIPVGGLAIALAAFTNCTSRLVIHPSKE